MALVPHLPDSPLCGRASYTPSKSNTWILDDCHNPYVIGLMTILQTPDKKDRQRCHPNKHTQVNEQSELFDNTPFGFTDPFYFTLKINFVPALRFSFFLN